MAWIGAVVGAAGSYMAAKESNKASKSGGGVNLTTTSEPWDVSSPYRKYGMEAGFQALTGKPSGYPTTYKQWELQPEVPGPGGGVAGSQPNGPASGGNGPISGAQKSQAPYTPRPGYRFNQFGKEVPIGKGQKPKPGGPTSAPSTPVATPQFGGVSQETNQIRQAMIDQAKQGNPLYGAAETYTQRTLDPTQGDPNNYRSETADMLRKYDDPQLARFQEMLFGELSGKGGGVPHYKTIQGSRSVGQSTGALGSSTGASGGPIASSGPVGVDKVLKDLLAGGDAPGAQAMRDRIRRQTGEAYDASVKDLRLRSVGSGMYGGSPYAQAEADASGRYSRNLTDSLAAADYDLYSQALGLGTQYDTSALDRAAQERMQANSISASAGDSAANRATQEYLGRLGALGDSLGLSTNNQQFRVSGMGQLANTLSEDQRSALAGVPDISGLRMRDWGAAGGLSLGADTQQRQFLADRGNEQAAREQAAVGRAQVGVGRANVRLGETQLDFDKWRYNRETPLRDTSAYLDIINQASGNYGTQNQQGFDQRAGGNSYVSPWGQALSGAAAGYSIGQSYQQSRK